MTLRTKVLVVGVGILLLAMIILGTLLTLVQRSNYLEEIEIRAHTFLAVLSVECTEALASNRVENLDSIITRLTESEMELFDVAFVTVLDRDLRVIGHTDQYRYGEVMEDDFFRRSSVSDTWIVERRRVDDQDLLMVSMPVATAIPGLPGLRWGTVIAGMRLERIERKLVALVAEALLILLILMSASAIITSILLNHQLVRPVDQLASAAREFASGDMTARSRVKGRDELALLSSTFNEMAGKIEVYTKSLEDEIRKRTRELEQSNSHLNEALRDLRLANQQLEELATTDGLTGLYNFRYFNSLLDMELLRSSRLDFPVSLVLLDVDHFKNFNDTHGHPAGDEVLRTLSSILRKRLRNTDVPCRYGGEEFVVVLLDTSYEMAMTVSEELRALVEETCFPGQEDQPGGNLTISLGVASFPIHADSKQTLVKAADDALYRAKKLGRNRVIGAGDPDEETPA